MSLRPEKKPAYPLIPRGESKCIWMEAGVISYKICDFDIDCEYCPFDRAMRGLESASPFAGNTLGPAPAVLDRISRFDIDAGRYYHPGHTWIKVEGRGRVWLGLDGLAAAILGSVDALVLPLPGETLTRCAPCGEIVQRERCFSLFSPLGGRVLAVNHEVAAAPARMVLSPMTEGWLMVVKPGDLAGDLKHCRTGREALSWCLKAVDWACSFISSTLERAKAGLGRTLYDGGEITGTIREILPASRYKSLVLRMLSAREEWWGSLGESGPLSWRKQRRIRNGEQGGTP